MLRRQRQLRAQVQRLVDGCLFGVALWLAHLFRTTSKLAMSGGSLFGGTPEIQPFEEYVWLLLIIVPAAPLLLEVQGFYNRAIIASRRLTAWQLMKACTVAVLLLISVMFLTREQLARSVIILFGMISFFLVLL